jgi:Tyrosyl-DNA phosphodiesterase
VWRLDNDDGDDADCPTGADVHRYGHMQLRALLHRQQPFPEHFRGAPLVCQFSSIGSLDEKWLLREFGASLSAGRCEAPAGAWKQWPAAAAQQRMAWLRGFGAFATPGALHQGAS